MKSILLSLFLYYRFLHIRYRKSSMIDYTAQKMKRNCRLYYRKINWLRKSSTGLYYVINNAELSSTHIIINVTVATKVLY
jgi:hypothetical protein